MTSQHDDKIGILFSLLNEISTFVKKTLKRMKIWSSYFLCRCAMGAWPWLWTILLMTSLMTSSCQKVGQISNHHSTSEKTFIRITKFRQLWKFWNFRYCLIWAWDMERLYANYTIKSIGHIYYAIGDVTMWRQIKSFIFPCKYIQCIFHHHFITNKVIIISACMY